MGVLRFWNIARVSNFTLLSTGEKIKYLLEKDILYVGETWSLYNRPNCVSWQNIDFSQFDKRRFDLFSLYSTDEGDSLNINPLFNEEVFENFQHKVETYYVDYDEYLLSIDLLESRDEKTDYLRNILKSQNVFKLDNIISDYNHHSRQLMLGHEMAIEFNKSSPDIFMDHLMGIDIPIRWYCHNKFIECFKNEYSHFAIAQWVLSKIEEINLNVQNNDELELLEDYGIPNNLKSYQYAYFFQSIGFVEKHFNKGVSYANIGKMISELVHLNHTNITNHIRTIRTTHVQNISDLHKEYQEEMDVYIKAYN